MNKSIIVANPTTLISRNYKVKLEFFDTKNSKKTVQQRELTNADDLNPFRENIAHSDEIGIMRESGVVLTAVRIYKGNEIIYDKYCVNNELETLLVLFNHK
jgi:hypothetical protein